MPESSRRAFVYQVGIGQVQSAIYLVVAALLVLAGGYTLVGTIVDVIEGSDSRAIGDTGLFVLDRVLLLFIIAELLYTLRLVDVEGQILVEPFLFIGLIAVVRRILVIVAEVEGAEERVDVTDFLIEIAALAGLILVLVLAIYLLRRAGEAPT